ncbi:MAG: serine hydrolase [Ignavibacteriales bacterium]
MLKQRTLLAILVALAVVMTIAVLATRMPGFRRPAPLPPSKGAGPDWQPLRASLESYIKSQRGQFAVYLYDFQSGSEMGINENETMYAASSIKLPVVLYLYTQASKGALSLDETVLYRPDSDYATGSGVIQYTAAPGNPYSLRTLGNLAITISDNAATKMLIRRLGIDNIRSFMGSLGGKVLFPDGRYYSTARDLGLYMRATKQFADSNPSLGGTFLYDLRHTITNEGITQELPGVSVAHKVGAAGTVATDVGLVLLDNRPYVLSVLTKDVGDTEVPGFNAIGRISRIVYDYLRAQGASRG